MHLLKPHPKPGKWSIYLVHTAGPVVGGALAGQHTRSIQEYRPSANDPVRNLVWERQNFIFEASFQFSHWDYTRNASNPVLKDVSEEIPIACRFVPWSYQDLMTSAREGRVSFSCTGVVTGVFTFEKRGSSIFTKVWKGDDLDESASIFTPE